MKLQGLLTMSAHILFSFMVAGLVACSGPHMPLDRSQKATGGGSTSSGKSSGSEITFENGIAQLFQQKCGLCHAPGGALPNWNDYDTTFSKQDRIRDRVLVKGDMPPKAVTPLDEEEKIMLGKWLGMGAPRGEVVEDTLLPPSESAQSAPEPLPNPVTPPAELPAASDSKETGPSVSPDEKVTFENTMKAWFKKNCSLCHDGSNPGLGLPNWLDFNTVLQQKDLIYKRVITEAGTSTEMPPGGFTGQGEKLSDSERSILKNWIEYGAAEK